MSQLMNVVRCSGCYMYQVEIQKKAKKWQCKVCGVKQSLKQVFFQGTGGQCRLQVQKLNFLKADCENESGFQSDYNISNHSDFSSSFSECNYNTNSLKRFRSNEFEITTNRRQPLFNSSDILKNEELPNFSQKKIIFESELTANSDDSSQKNISVNISQIKRNNGFQSRLQHDFKTKDNPLSDYHDGKNFNSISSNVLHEEGDKESQIIFQKDYKLTEYQVYEDTNQRECKYSDIFQNNDEKIKFSHEILLNKSETTNQDSNSIFSNILIEDEIESDLEDLETLKNEKNSTLSIIKSQKSLLNTDGIYIETKQSIFESNNDLDLSLDF